MTVTAHNTVIKVKEVTKRASLNSCTTFKKNTCRYTTHAVVQTPIQRVLKEKQCTYRLSVGVKPPVETTDEYLNVKNDCRQKGNLFIYNLKEEVAQMQSQRKPLIGNVHFISRWESVRRCVWTLMMCFSFLIIKSRKDIS